MGKEIRQVEVSKELDDVLALLIVVARDVRAGKSVAEIAADALSKLVDAAAGIDQVSAEVAADRKVALQTIGYRTGELADALLA